MELTSEYKYKKVMVIDDSHIDRYIAQKIIKKSLFAEETILAESAIDALNYLRANTEAAPQVIFLDIRIPEMDGFEFLEQYNSLPENVKDNCAIAIISSSADINDHKRAESNKYVHCFIHKPLDKEKLDKHFIV